MVDTTRVLVWMLAASLAQPTYATAGALPSEAVKALQENQEGISSIIIAWERRRRPAVRPELAVLKETKQERAKKFFRPSKTRYVRKGTRFRCEYISSIVQELPRGDVTTYNGANIYIGPLNKDLGALAIWDEYHIAHYPPPEQHLYYVELLERAGFIVNSKIKDFRTAPRSEVLFLSEQNDAVVDVSQESENLEVRIQAAGLRYRFLLDPKLGYAVKEREVLSNDGRRLTVTRNERFSKLDGATVWLPRNISTTWYTWPTVPEHITEAPLIYEDFSVYELQTAYNFDDAGFTLDKPRPGTFVMDSRLPTAREREDGVVRYQVPADPKDIDDTIAAAIAGEDYQPRSKLFSRMILGSLVLIALIAVFVLARRARRKDVS